MKRLFLMLLVCIAALLAAPAAVHAQEDRAPITFSQEELDQLLAPVALYPDNLLSQVLMAATYPMEVVQAARFARQHPNLRGEDLAEELEGQPWDASVKALVEFPSVLAMMDDQLAWTQKLGDAFLAQQEQVMDTVQELRARAYEAGTLQSTPQQRVIVQDRLISIESTSPDAIYVPYYDPRVVYGQWWWPHRPPMVWTPPPAYRPRSYGGAIAFGVGVAALAAIVHQTRPDWRRHHFTIHDRHRPAAPPAVWSHNPGHRHGTPYRDARTYDRYRPGSPTVGVNRDHYRGRVPAGLPHLEPRFHPQQPAPVTNRPIPSGLPHLRPQHLPQQPGYRPQHQPQQPQQQPGFRPQPQPQQPQQQPGFRPQPQPQQPQQQPGVRPKPQQPQPQPGFRPQPQPQPQQPAPGANRPTPAGPPPQRSQPQPQPQPAPATVQRPPAPTGVRVPQPPNTRQPSARDQFKPFSPAGSAQSAQSQAERGRTSREGSNFNRQGPNANAGVPRRPDQQNNPRQNERRQ